MDPQFPIAVSATDIPVRSRPSIYPEPFATQMSGRAKRVLGDLFGQRNFGVNMVTLAPGAVSSLRHAHALQDEFIYVLRGQPTLHTDEGETELEPGMFAGFRAGSDSLNRTPGHAPQLGLVSVPAVGYFSGLAHFRR